MADKNAGTIPGKIIVLDEGTTSTRAMLFEALDNVEGTPREIVVFNAGAALYAANCVGSIADGIKLARETIASGAARRKLDQFIAATKKIGAGDRA